jgi:hypothetical protein
MKERRGGVHNRSGHVAVHGIECKVCDKNGWELGCLSCQAAVSEKRLSPVFCFVEEGGETYHPRNAESERTQSTSTDFNHSTSAATFLSFVSRKEDNTSMLFWRSTR